MSLRLLTVTTGFAVVLASTPQQQPAPTFRAGAVLVPIDLRVMDRNGQAVTDLKAGDIKVYEDGVLQELKHFSTQGAADAASGNRASRRQSLGSTITPQANRVFLILLGRGRLQEPSKGIDALVHFVRTRLLPQDQVAVFAYDRATAFTTDHEQIATILERFRAANGGIEQEMQQYFTGLVAVYGDKYLPASLRRKIDTVFQTTGNNSRELPAAPIAAEHRIAEEFSDPFDLYISSNRQTLQDLGNLYTGIEYLRQLEGEKHLIFVTEAGLNLPRLEDDKSLAAIASDARVTIDPIQTGGVIAPIAIDSFTGAPSTGPPSSAATLRQSFAFVTLRTLAELTGGQASVNSYAEQAVDRINGATRFGYLLGYTPTNMNWDDHYRRLRIVIDRPDVTAFYRHGYYGRDIVPTADRRQIVITSRMNSALAFRKDIRDLKLKASARTVAGLTTGTTIDVTVNVDASRVSFVPKQNQQVATIVVALVCLDSRQRVIGQTVEEVIQRYDDAGRVQAIKDGINYTGRVRSPAMPASIKVVVYDDTADLLGTVVVTAVR